MTATGQDAPASTIEPGPDAAAAATLAPSTAELKERFAPVFAKIAAGARDRERDRRLGHEAIRLLSEASFTRVRLPIERGGLGASIEQLIDLLVDLGAADSNLPQALHGHFLFTEVHQHQHQGAVSDWWFKEVAAGKVFGNAIVEKPASAGTRPAVIEALEDGRYRVTGDKFYSTGTLLSDYVLVEGELAGTGSGTEKPQRGALILGTLDQGVELVDDWNGIGQRLTASGTTRLHGAAAPAGRLMAMGVPANPLGFTLVWLILAATGAGIARAAADEAAAYARGRERTYEHASAATTAGDPLMQHAVGQISARASAARSIVVDTASTVAHAFESTRGITDMADPVFRETYAQAYVAVSEAYSVVSELSVAAANEVFEVGGASVLDAARQLDRHWRNARTVASHSPGAYRLRAVGDYRINGTVPPLSARSTGPAPAQHAATTADAAAAEADQAAQKEQS
ncbi:acyl-CoA dehydrogenase family protein [Micrococcus terreus]|uniref:acyl-CoA dehydrogenase family protein n=1 Tax=Micrococcus terreus TaxID=574650 RepID=UPI003D73AA00